MELENANSVIEVVTAQELYLEKKPFMEMSLVIKNCSGECLKKLAKHYEPVFRPEETIIKPTEVAPYNRFGVRRSPQLFVEFRGPMLDKTVTFN